MVIHVTDSTKGSNWLILARDETSWFTLWFRRWTNGIYRLGASGTKEKLVSLVGVTECEALLTWGFFNTGDPFFMAPACTGAEWSHMAPAVAKLMFVFPFCSGFFLLDRGQVWYMVGWWLFVLTSGGEVSVAGINFWDWAPLSSYTSPCQFACQGLHMPLLVSGKANTLKGA